jgi:hypothetical protein
MNTLMIEEEDQIWRLQLISNCLILDTYESVVWADYSRRSDPVDNVLWKQ